MPKLREQGRGTRDEVLTTINFPHYPLPATSYYYNNFAFYFALGEVVIV